MSLFRFDYTLTPTDKLSVKERSWKSIGSITAKKVEEGHHEKPKNGIGSGNTTIPEGWKPFSMTTPILAAIGVSALLMAAAIEVMAQRSQAQGGLALSPSLDEIPQYAMLTYLYVPQILAVLYSLVWSWVDLDVKRMQPWFELSRPSGATADNSLFLDYPVDFVAFVPFKAGRRKY